MYSVLPLYTFTLCIHNVPTAPIHDVYTQYTAPIHVHVMYHVSCMYTQCTAPIHVMYTQCTAPLLCTLGFKDILLEFKELLSKIYLNLVPQEQPKNINR